MDPEVFRAPNRLLDQILRMTEVGCYVSSTLFFYIFVRANCRALRLREFYNFSRGLRTSDIIYAARCKVCDLIYVGETEKEMKTRFCNHRYDSKSRPSNNNLPEHIHKFKHNFETDIEVFILKQGFKSTLCMVFSVLSM